MDSFFDVWTELRIGDASQPFVEADSSFLLELTQIIPEPSSVILVAIGLMMLLGYRRI